MTATPGPSTGSLIDTDEMVAVHRAFRRELVLIPRLVRAVPAGDTARAGVVARHARLVLKGLHIHHTGEDLLLWPTLLERAAPSAEVIHRMESQHGRVNELVGRLEPAVTRWQAEARPAEGEELAATFDELRLGLVEHLDDEEREILPIAARSMSTQEWAAIGQHSAAEMAPSERPLMFGMILEEATPDERASMLATLPPPVRVLMRTVGSVQYRRYVGKVRAER